MLDNTNALFKAQVVGRLVDGVEMRYWSCTGNADGHWRVDVVTGNGPSQRGNISW